MVNVFLATIKATSVDVFVCLQSEKQKAADPVVEFKTLARRDAFERMDQELKLLFDTVPDDRKEVKSSCMKVRVLFKTKIHVAERPP